MALLEMILLVHDHVHWLTDDTHLIGHVVRKSLSSLSCSFFSLEQKAGTFLWQNLKGPKAFN